MSAAVDAPFVHLGVGAFARAHLGVYADDLLALGHVSGIRGVSLRSDRAERLLGPQGGRYALLVREPGEAPEARVLGAFRSVATGREAAVAAVADPATTLVTLTITEMGYDGDAPAVLAEGLARRGDVPLVVASLDNVAGNGALLRARVEAAGGPVADAVRFPDSVVDRMVPATTDADRDEAEGLLGWRDEAVVVAERHCSWIIEAVDGLPPLAEVGVALVDDIAPFRRRKLWLLNGPHSALAHLGLLAGCATIAEAAAHPLVAPFVHRVALDAVEVAEVPDAAAFAAEALRRFANPALGHTCTQVATDGGAKLPQRILPVVAERRRRGLPTTGFALVVAACAEPVIVDDPAFAAEVAAARAALDRHGVDALREAA